MRKSRRKRHSSWLNFIVTTVFAIVSLLLVFTIMTKSLDRVDKSKTTHTAVIDTIESSYPGIKIVTETSNDENAPYAVQYPQSEYIDFNHRVIDYIQSAKTDYFQSLDKGSGELNISFETFHHPSGYYSFIFFKNHYVRGEHSGIVVDSFHLNPKTGDSIDIATLLNQNEAHLLTLSTYIKEAIASDPNLEGHLINENVELATEPLWDNFRNFALTEEGLSFYFNQSDIASSAKGTPVIKLAISKVSPLLAKEYQATVPPVVQQEVNNLLDKPINSLEKKPDVSVSKGETAQLPSEKASKHVKKVALTFDDGPDPNITPQILKTLKKYDAKATFFMLGSRVEYYPDLARRVLLEGHEIGNHTWTHSNLTKANKEKINNEVAKTAGIIEGVTGAKATVFRPPYGAINEHVRSHIDLPIILWDVDTLDWKYRSSSHLLEAVKKHTKDGSIILMHDIHQATANGLDAVLAHLQEEGYIFVTVSELGTSH